MWRMCCGLLVAALTCRTTVVQCLELDPKLRTHAFYYAWYGTPGVDGRWKHWDHEVLPHWTPQVSAQYPAIGTRFKPPQALHSPFYPLAGPYSSADPATVRRHFRELRQAGVGVAALSWWGPQWRQGTTDTQGVSTDQLLPVVLEAAEAEGLRVAFHLEPYPGRSAATTREDLLYLMRRVGGSPAVLRLRRRGASLAPGAGGDDATAGGAVNGTAVDAVNATAGGAHGLPLFYVYDSFHIPPEDWAALLQPGGEASLRGTEADGIFVGLWLNQHDGDMQLLPGGFDGFYTYFASEAVSYGADPSNWPTLSAWARDHSMLFVPSVGPGYDDSKIRPWNAAATRDREGGERYRRWWEAALDAQPAAVSITSFNEWGEGTQIEAARAPDGGEAGGGTARYQSYGGTTGHDEWLYMRLTAGFAARLGAQQRQRGGAQQHGGGAHSEL
ncbi:glyco endo-alpha-1,2-mannosidase [Micractinium conductrix]|uniref:Glyco endo-alpha-1,2-mannosidase n=1 Tax=Micractinium conductrix TaxID=554055 RepID=A0A2P6V857_9CHLO|nr:glyco endo-alpha-1,2-mannosidase [Micractinium conductrix]|eukprot:PSC70263.1 glyco endo-alpha-1,2-mannosidase [Micractinium conductrix]